MAIEASGGAGQSRRTATRSIPTLGGRLPPLVGRANELRLLCQWLGEPGIGLVTVVGAAGCGKTRLALAAAQTLVSGSNGRVHLVDLSPLTDAADVLPSISVALGVPEHEAGSSVAALCDVLGEEPTLIVLDNAEHVATAAPDLAALLQTSPRLALLVTSRLPLGLYGEREFPLDPLPVPFAEDANDAGPEGAAGLLPPLLDCPSVQLFVQMARMVRPDFELTAANARAVAGICTRLDGLPLAIELAAARVKVLSPEALLRRLTEPSVSSLRELTSDAPNRPERHRTLDRAIAWSYALLAPEEQRIFRAVSVFAGGFDLDVVEAVVRPSAVPEPVPPTAACEPGDRAAQIEPVPLEGLAVLVNHSLIRRTDDDPEGLGRFSMLATIREFALEQLAASGESERVRAAHARCMASLAESVEPRRDCAVTPQPRQRLERNWENLRAAFHWAVTDHRDPALGLHLAGALGWFWKHGGRLREGRGWLRSALDEAPDAADALRAKALLALGGIEFILDDIPAALASLDEAVALARLEGDSQLLGMALNRTACVLSVTGDTAREMALYAEAIALFRSCGDAPGAGAVLNGLGEAARVAGDFAAARAHYEASLATVGDASPHLAAVVHHNLGYVAEAEGDVPAMAASFQRGHSLAREAGDESSVALCIAGLGAAARSAGDPERAARLFGAFEALLERSVIRFDLADRAAYERNVSLARETLGEACYATAREAGRQLTADELLAEAQLVDGCQAARTPATRRANAANPLTRREAEVALLVARGLTNRQIAEELTIAERTAGTHIEHIMAKLGLHTRAQVAAWVTEQRPRPLPDPLRVA